MTARTALCVGNTSTRALTIHLVGYIVDFKPTEDRIDFKIALYYSLYYILVMTPLATSENMQYIYSCIVLIVSSELALGLESS